MTDSSLPPAALQLGSLRLALCPNASAPRETDADWVCAPTFALWLETDDLPAAYARACAAGGRPLEEPDDEHFEIADPDGNPIEVWLRDAED